MNKVWEKFLIALITIMILSNFLLAHPILATDEDRADDFLDGIVTLLGGLVGILTLPERLTAVSVADALNTFTANVVWVDDEDDDADIPKNILNQKTVTPYEILFNKVTLLDVNFFNITDATGDEAGALVNKVRKSVAGWYYAMRSIAAAILLCILIYVGIRMALSTIASDRAMYKKMLVDWVCSLLLIFVLQYIMLFTIYVNNAIVNAIGASGGDGLSKGILTIKDIANDIFNVNALAATIVYCMLIWQTFALFISYFNRMIKVAFLIIISPLISITYSIDKIGDGKAQALGNWLKEFIFTILMQPFHCAIYMCMVSTAVNLLITTTDNSEALGRSLIVILSIKFIKEAEKLVRKIFSFADDNKGTSLAAGMMASSMALTKAKQMGKSAKNFTNGAKNMFKNFDKNARNAYIDAVAIGRYLKSKDENKSFEETKAEVKEEKDNLHAQKLEERNKKKEKYRSTQLGKKIAAVKAAKKGITSATAEIKAKDALLEQRTQEKMNASGGTMTESQARAEARLELAKEDAREKSFLRPIDRAVGKVKGLNKRLNSSEVVKLMKELGKDKMASGMGLFVGGGILGTNGDIGTAIMSAGAVKGVARELLESSGSAIANETKSMLKETGFKTSAQALAAVDDIEDNKDKYTVGTEKAEEELDKLSKYLDTLGDGISKDLRANVENTIRSSPESASGDVSDILDGARQKLVNKHGEDSQEVKDFDSNSDKLKDYASKVSLSSAMDRATASGMSISEFKSTLISGTASDMPLWVEDEYQDDQDVAASMVNLDELQVPPGATEEEQKAIYDAEREQKVLEARKKAEERVMWGDLDRLDNAYVAEAEAQRKLAAAIRDAGGDEDLAQAIEARVAELEKTRREVIGGALTERDTRLENYSTKLALEYKNEIEKKLEELMSKANGDISKLSDQEQVQLSNVMSMNLHVERNPAEYKAKEERFSKLLNGNQNS